MRCTQYIVHTDEWDDYYNSSTSWLSALNHQLHTQHDSRCTVYTSKFPRAATHACVTARVVWTLPFPFVCVFECTRSSYALCTCSVSGLTPVCLAWRLCYCFVRIIYLSCPLRIIIKTFTWDIVFVLFIVSSILFFRLYFLTPTFLVFIHLHVAVIHTLTVHLCNLYL